MRDKRRLPVILDTSIIIHALERGVDLIEGLYEASTDPVEIIVPRAVLKELERLEREGDATRKRKARIALAFLTARKSMVRVTETPEGPTDVVILDLAERLKGAVATSDTKLWREATKRGLRVFFLWDSRRRIEEYPGTP